MMPEIEQWFIIETCVIFQFTIIVIPKKGLAQIWNAISAVIVVKKIVHKIDVIVAAFVFFSNLIVGIPDDVWAAPDGRLCAPFLDLCVFLDKTILAMDKCYLLLMFCYD